MMDTTQARSFRTTVRGVAVTRTRSCRLQSSGAQLTTTAAVPLPFRPDRALQRRAGILVQFALTPPGVPAGVFFVQADRLAGGGLPPNPATTSSYPVIQITANTPQARRISRSFLPLAGDPPLFVARGGGIAGASTLEVE